MESDDEDDGGSGDARGRSGPYAIPIYKGNVLHESLDTGSGVDVGYDDEDFGLSNEPSPIHSSADTRASETDKADSIVLILSSTTVANSASYIDVTQTLVSLFVTFSVSATL